MVKRVLSAGKKAASKAKVALSEAQKKKNRETAKNKAEAKITPLRANKGKGQPVSKSAIREASTANALDTMQRRIDDMPDGTRKKMMQNLLDGQRKQFEAGQSADVDRAGRKSAQANRDRKMKDKVTLAPMPFKEGGLAKPSASQAGLKKLPTAVRNKMGYMKNGGSVKKGSTDMRKGGMFY